MEVRDRYKHPFDLALLAAAGLLLAPLWLVLALAIPLAIRLEDGGRIFYVQRRLGRHGRPFGIVKFRTMAEGAEDGTGPVWAAREDPRTTRVGRVLRRLNLDELPQAVNVLKGEMSLVGPRPERPELAERFEREVPGFARRLRALPGIMGLAQARGNYHTHPRRKLRYDNLYISAMGPALDLTLCALCIRKAIRTAFGLAPAAAPGARGAGGGRPLYDYLLVAGPGRSGSTFLYELLDAHPGFTAPDIKEGYLYRAPRRLDRALRRAAPAVVLDVANLAWRDPALAGGVAALRARGHLVLIVVLLRDHRERAVSMFRFRRSRGELAALLGRRALQRAVLRDSLTPADLSRLFGLGADTLTIGFAALTGHTVRVLDIVAGLCGTAAFEDAPCRPVNRSVRARSLLLSAAGKLAALALRKAGCRRLLRRLKASARVQRIFFRPGGGGRIDLGEETEALLASHSEACRRAAAAAGERLAEEIWFRRAGDGAGSEAAR